MKTLALPEVAGPVDGQLMFKPRFMPGVDRTYGPGPGCFTATLQIRDSRPGWGWYPKHPDRSQPVDPFEPFNAAARRAANLLLPRLMGA